MFCIVGKQKGKTLLWITQRTPCTRFFFHALCAAKNAQNSNDFFIHQIDNSTFGFVLRILMTTALWIDAMKF